MSSPNSKIIISIRGVPWYICYSIESFETLKASIFSLSRNPNGRCKENDVPNL
jgi:hypothetical protein